MWDRLNTRGLQRWIHPAVWPSGNTVLWRDSQGEMNAEIRKDRGITETCGDKRHQNIEEDASETLTYCASSFPNLSPRFTFFRQEAQKRWVSINSTCSRSKPRAWVSFEGTQVTALVRRPLLPAPYSCAVNSSSLSSERNSSGFLYCFVLKKNCFWSPKICLEFKKTRHLVEASSIHYRRSWSRWGEQPLNRWESCTPSPEPGLNG